MTSKIFLKNLQSSTKYLTFTAYNHNSQNQLASTGLICFNILYSGLKIQHVPSLQTFKISNLNVAPNVNCVIGPNNKLSFCNSWSVFKNNLCWLLMICVPDFITVNPCMHKFTQICCERAFCLTCLCLLVAIQSVWSNKQHIDESLLAVFASNPEAYMCTHISYTVKQSNYRLEATCDEQTSWFKLDTHQWCVWVLFTVCRLWASNVCKTAGCWPSSTSTTCRFCPKLRRHT